MCSVLLDLDGTLVDSLPGIKSSCLSALRALGHVPPPAMDWSGIIGPPIEDIMRLLLEPCGDNRIAEAVAAYRAHYGRHGLFASLPYPGVREALLEMRQSGARLYLATSKRTKFASMILDHLHLTEHFDAIYGSEDGGALDHKPQLISFIIERHALVRSRSVMVGDRRHDIAGAHANSLRALGVLWGYGTRNELAAAEADCLVTEPAELPAAVVALTMPGSKRP